jgi:hypothetical protein
MLTMPCMNVLSTVQTMLDWSIPARALLLDGQELALEDVPSSNATFKISMSMRRRSDVARCCGLSARASKVSRSVLIEWIVTHGYIAKESDAAASIRAWATPCPRFVMDWPASSKAVIESSSWSVSTTAGIARATSSSLRGTIPCSTREVLAQSKIFSKLVGQERWPTDAVRRRMGERRLAPELESEGVRGRPKPMVTGSALSFPEGGLGAI